MSNQTDHTIVRLRVPPELKQKIEKSAEESNRSQSAEMVARLEQSFDSSAKHPDFIIQLANELNNQTIQLNNRIGEQEKAFHNLEAFYKEHISSIQSLELMKEKNYKLHIQSLEDIIQNLQEILKNQEK